MSSALQSKNCLAKKARLAVVMFVSTYSVKISMNCGRLGMFPSVRNWLATDIRKSCCVPMRPISAEA